MEELGDESVDLIVTDPPYQLSTIERFGKPDSGEKWSVKSGVYHRVSKGFMGQEWDVLPPVEVWQECLRVLKPGAFAFLMTTTRQDSLCQILSDLTHAGFQMGFSSLYWCYAQGFPKAMSISKAVDKRLGTYKEGKPTANARFGYNGQDKHYNHAKITREFDAQSPQAKALDGSYAGFQPKPAVEVIIVAMKPLSEKTFVDQALKNRKGITWLDSVKIPYESEGDKSQATPQGRCTGQVYDSMLGRERKDFDRPEQKGRFPANLLVSDDVLNIESKSVGHYSYQLKKAPYEGGWKSLEDKGNLRESNHSFSRYFDLDSWWAEKLKQLPQSAQRTFPFAIISKASKSEKNKGCEGLPDKLPRAYRTEANGASDRPSKGMERFQGLPVKNTHPTVKPIKLMSYLITLGSREGDTVVDPFIGTGATAIACQILGRKCTGYEINANYCEIAKSRLTYYCQKAMNL